MTGQGVGRRAFVRVWAAREGYVVYPEQMAEMVWSTAHLDAIRIIPMTVISIPGRVYSHRSVMLGG